MVRSRVNPPIPYDDFSKWSTCKRRRACCPASYSSPSCSSRPSRQGWPSSCHFSPGLSGVAHFYSKKKTATILQHLHTEPVALIFILSTFLLFLLRRLPAHTSFNLKAEKMQHSSDRPKFGAPVASYLAWLLIILTCSTWSSILALPVACFLVKQCVFTNSTRSSLVMPTSRMPWSYLYNI